MGVILMQLQKTQRYMIGLLFLSLCISQSHAQWQSLYYRDHALVGKIFSTQDQQWVTEAHLIEALQGKQFLLLGETHTNADHHIGQARLLAQWIADAQRPTALVFEMLNYDDWIDFREPRLTLEELTQKLENVAERWPWELYQPVLQLQIKHQLPMVGGNLSRAQLDKYSSREVCELSRKELTINTCDALDQSQQETIKQLIFDAHCEYLPLANTQPLLQVQMAKDASFALSLANNTVSHQVALIAGAVHVRKDIGVPVHLQALGYSIAKSIVSVAFINVHPEKSNVADYFDSPHIAEQYDYLLFTPSERNQDPCEEFAEQLKRMKHKPKH